MNHRRAARGWALTLGLAAGLSLCGTIAALGKNPAPGTAQKQRTFKQGTGGQVAANCTQCRQDCMGKAIALVKKDKLKASSREGQTAKNNYWLECNRNECDGKGQPCGPKE